MADTFELAAARPSEVALSPDGSRLYSAGGDGVLRVYDIKTGTLIDSWQVGTNLGGLDLSPDGSFLMVVERQPISVVHAPGPQTTITVYKVNVVTGETTSYPYIATSLDHTFFDVAILSDGKALLSQNFNGSGWTQLKLLDPSTGVYAVGDYVEQSSVLTRSEDGAKVLIGGPNNSGGPLRIYQAGTGIVAASGSNGFNWGIQAFTGSGDLVAQYIYNEGINIFNGSLQRQIILTSSEGVDWRYGRVTDFAFDASGEHLFVLDNVENRIVNLRVSDWSIVASIPVDAEVGSWAGQLGATHGSRLILEPQGRYFSVVTDSGLVLVENPGAPAMAGTPGADVMDGTVFADSMNASDGDDVLEGGDGDDTLNGEGGDDRLAGGKGKDSYSGGPGTDTVDFSGEPGPVVVNLQPGAFIFPSGHPFGIRSVGPGEALDSFGNYETLSGIENLILTAGNDRVLASEGANRIEAGAGNDNIIGAGGNDVIDGGEGNDSIDGGAGDDSMSGGVGNDIFVVDSAADTVVENAGEGTDEIRTPLASYSLLGTNVENLRAFSNLAHDFRGNASDNVITGAGSSDLIRLQDGGSDTALGGGGDDGFYFGGALDALDHVDGGTGINDQLVLQGDYSAPTVLGANVLINVEVLSILPGIDARFGDTSGASYDYNLEAVDSNVAAGGRLVVDFTNLGAGEDVTFDGSAETDGAFTFGAGRGVDDLTGGSGADLFLFRGGRFGASDQVDGGGGSDELALRGDYSGANALTFGAAAMTDIEVLSILSGQNTRFGKIEGDFSYDITTDDGNVAASRRLVVDAGQLTANETLVFDGGAETDGYFWIAAGFGNDLITGGQGNDLIIGGGGSDTLYGGGGNDTFVYRSIADSNPGGQDGIQDFSLGDILDLAKIDANSALAGDQAFSFIGDNAFAGLGAASVGQLRAVDGGGGLWTVYGDTDGNGSADFQFAVVVTGGHVLGASDFIL